MTDEQVGVYIRMLCAQHQHGGRIDTNVLRSYCNRITNGDTVFSKFVHDESGSYNERLEIEMEKRREKSAKAAESVKKRWEKSKNQNTYERNTNVIRSENENENRNENENEIVIEDKIEKKPAIEIPEGFPFETEYAKQAMRDYIQHRRQLKVKPYTKIGLERAMKEWQLWGEASFIEQVNETIRNNWQGIFPPKHISNNGQQRTQTTQRPTGRVEPSPAGTPFGKL